MSDWWISGRRQHARVRQDITVRVSRLDYVKLKAGFLVMPIFKDLLPKDHWSAGLYGSDNAVVADTGYGLAIILIEDLEW